MIILSSSLSFLWEAIPEPWGAILNWAFFIVIAAGAAVWSIYALMYYAYQWRHGAGWLVTRGVAVVLAYSVLSVYALVATTMFIVMTLIGFPILIFTDEHGGWAVFVVIFAIVTPGALLVALAVINIDKLDKRASVWLKGHFPPDWGMLSQ